MFDMGRQQRVVQIQMVKHTTEKVDERKSEGRFVQESGIAQLSPGAG